MFDELLTWNFILFYLIWRNGKIVTKRQFECKVNQITVGKQKCLKTGKMKWFLKDEFTELIKDQFDDCIVIIDEETN